MVIVANIVTVFTVAALYRLASRSCQRLPTEGTGLIEAFRYSIPATSYGAAVSEHRLDVFFVNAFRGTADLGIYRPACCWPSRSASCQRGAVVLFPSVVAAGDHREQGALVAQANRLMLAVSVACGATLALLAPWGIPLIFGNAFRAAYGAAVVLPGAVVFTTNTCWPATSLAWAVRASISSRRWSGARSRSLSTSC